MAHFGKILRAEIEAKCSSLREFAEKAGISPNTLQKWMNDATPHGFGTTYSAIARALGMTPTELDRLWRSTRVPQQGGDARGGIPILSEVPAGNGDFDPTQLGLDNGVGMEYISRAAAPGVVDPLAYALIIRGDSMAPRLSPGMVIICSPAATHVSGKIYAVRFGSERDNECTVKRVYDIGGGMLMMHPDNPAYKPFTVNREHVVRMDMVTHVFGEVD